MTAKTRCPWPGGDPLMESYHDDEWGVPVTDDARHFEFLVLDGFQAGLSWRTILHKRENFRKAFVGFDVAKVARFRPTKVERLMQDAGIVRNRQKIEATLGNAKAFLKVQTEFGSFNDFIWQLAMPRVSRRYGSLKGIPAKTAVSERMSKDLLARGFRFVGPTICYAYMQAAGMVNDHLASCFVHEKTEKIQLKRLKAHRL
jgi:DNA-3-methyladenine glycosylase I